MRCAFGIFVAAVIGACAQTPERVGPAYVSPIAYERLSCQQLRKERARLLGEFAVAAPRQNEAINNDAYGLILPVWPATIRFATEDYGPQIAVLKGQMAAVDQAAMEKNCG
jgi:hypothetical protein